MNKFAASMVALVGAMVAATPAIAFPEQPIVVNSCQPAGGGNDRNLQALVPFAEQALNVPLISQYRPGAGGTLAFQEMAGMQKDGHMLVLCDQGGAIFGPIVQNIDFGPDGAIPIARLSLVPWVVTAHSSTPFTTLEELFEYVRKEPGKLRISIADVGSADHYTWLSLMKRANLPLTDVRWLPYGGGAPKVRAMLAGEAQVDMLLVPLIRDAIKDGTVRILAVAAPERLADLPDVPTLTELGIDISDGLVTGLWAPPGTPQERVDTLRAGVAKIKDLPEYQKIYQQLGQDINQFLPGDQYQAEWDKTWSEARDLLQSVIAQ